MNKIALTTLFLLGISSVYGQITYTTHTVQQGENLTQIAQKYYTTTTAIRSANPSITDELATNQQLKVPNRNGVKLHKVQPKETLYAISREYKVSIDQLNDWNPVLRAEGLQQGQTIVVSAPDNSIDNTQDNNKNHRYVVGNSETIYGIAVRHKITVSEIYEVNEGVAGQKIQEGDVIWLPAKAQNVNLKSDTNLTENKSLVTADYRYVKVEPQQTIYSLSKDNDISIEELVNLNPSLKNGLQAGMQIKLPVQKSTQKFPIQQGEKVDASSIDLQQSTLKSAIVYKEQKEIVFLLPFNNNYLTLENNKPLLDNKLQKDVFLNMTLDFYSGVLLALDEIQKQNHPVNVRIIDSKESNRNMDIDALLAENNFSQSDVIIGPFFQSNADALSTALQDQPTYIVSPLSTDEGEGHLNQVRAMPTSEMLKSGMMDYMTTKQKNIVYLTHQQQSIDFGVSSGTVLTINSKGDNLSVEQLKAELKKYVGNYIVLDSDSLEAAINLTNILADLRTEFDLQLVFLERSSILDSSEISIQTLADLKTTFPSVTADFDHYKYNEFYNQFYQKYQRSPNRFAVRGYDITMDVLQRLQQTTPEDTKLFDKNSEQVENAFEYINKADGIYNSGIYILYFDTDLSIRNAY